MSRAHRYLPLHMTRDDRAALIDRRKAACAKIDVCGDRWIARYTTQGAKCPDVCLRFVRRERPARLVLSGGGGAVMSGGTL